MYKAVGTGTIEIKPSSEALVESVKIRHGLFGFFDFFVLAREPSGRTGRPLPSASSASEEGKGLSFRPSSERASFRLLKS